jgi:hypothetical protein
MAEKDKKEPYPAPVEQTSANQAAALLASILMDVKRQLAAIGPTPSSTTTPAIPPDDPAIEALQVFRKIESRMLISPAPKIAAIEPPTGQAGDIVTIRGEHFFAVTFQLKFGNEQAPVDFVSEFELRAVVPPGPPVGPVDVVLTTFFGTVRFASFTYVATS